MTAKTTPTSDQSTMRDAITVAQDVLQKESAALATMAKELPADFVSAVEAILNVKGRVVISGVGKSGHIGRKIAATMASTGTPSYFVHGAEASHGDLGMVTPDDVCILISNSGETAELRDITLYTRRFNIPLIAISSKINSTLMQAADHKLNLPPVPEVCSIGKAPTTSTTLTLALGDALAVAVMEQRGFNADQFQTFHPGGKLGSQMSQVHQLMHGVDSLPIVAANDDMSEVLLTMTSKGFGVAMVVEGGKLKGLISDGDLRRNMSDLMGKTAGEIASTDPVTIQPDLLAVQALAILNERKISSLAVTDDDGVPVGIIHIHDLLRAGVV
ncbi:KpsF/GutQ family sugar-phosphate isomerase [Cognatishimia sp. 1_MG-2023]|uniref:KpsF/GutQ family sugar-phosphate isomerase n=1 Tax=Cognatishimia sp. 1_MG-2023 TaxID=3062642 RepID=UPI0026E4651F|nr:KpsF/GutQ family sugar-phosphate isomerase [Cognatishimia sp. 1_MG-2023]MDO6728100.1 KpsF/GutQ family sugar-phosphate isomerase [Cognatishimia sp. 1_MG-2023]